jgi:hypothetical protein
MSAERNPAGQTLHRVSAQHRAGKVITNVLLNEPGVTGVYYDE